MIVAVAVPQLTITDLPLMVSDFDKQRPEAALLAGATIAAAATAAAVATNIFMGAPFGGCLGGKRHWLAHP